MSGHTSHLPAGGNFDYRSRVLERGIVKLNAVIDRQQQQLALARLRSRPDEILFTGVGLNGPNADEWTKVYDREPAFVLRGPAIAGQSSRFSSGMTRNVASQSIRVPVLSSCVGLPGRDADEIAHQISVVGLVDQSGRDSGTGEPGLNVLTSGMTTVTNTGDLYMPLGALVRGKVPTAEEAKHIKFSSGDRANEGKGGRAPLILVPYNPAATNYYAVACVRRAIDRYYEFKGGAWIARTGGGLGAHSLLGKFDKGVFELVEGLVDFVTAVGIMVTLQQNRGAADPADAAVAAGKPVNRTLIIEALRYGRSRHDPAHNPSAYQNSVAVEKLLTALHPMQRILRGLGTFRDEIESTILGWAAMGAMPGHNFDCLLLH